jgi:2-polyprenyl-3-methyl-5-hydroxy-6-metoxy-1,4-benzoquinol methylase
MKITLKIKGVMALFALLAVNMEMMAQENTSQHVEEKHSTHTANDFMHQTPVDQLIQRFESPERDAYQKPQKVIDFLGDIKGKTIMDIGAGSGYFSIKLAKAGAKVIAADVNDEFQDYLKKRLEAENTGEGVVELRKIPYDSPGLKNQEVDMVFMANVYHHIESREDYFARAQKGLKKDGSLVIVDYYKTDLPVGPPLDHKVSIDEVIAELKAAGFQHFDVEVNLLPYQFIIKAQ